MPIWRSSRRIVLAPMLEQGAAQQPARRSFLKTMLAGTAGAAALLGLKPREARADGDPFLGEIALVGFNFAPVGWAMCNGQLLPISQNVALFSLLGTFYGGDGVNTFALPDLRGRMAIHSGQGPGLSSYVQGQLGGTEVVTLTAAQMPQHTHQLTGSSSNGTSNSPVNAVPAVQANGVPVYSATPNANLSPNAIGLAGGNLPHSNLQPYLSLNYIIALQGIFPSRS